MTIGKLNILSLLLAVFAVSGTAMAGSCDDYLKDNGATSGVVPNFTEDGKIRSFSIFAEQSFLVPKRSLINKARRQAEMKGKRDFSEWIKTKIQAGTLNEELLEQTEKTTADGKTSGSVEEVTKYADVIGAQTDSVLSGIIKLDECMDPEEKAIMVRMGWKASLSEAAADTRATIDNSVARGESGQTSEGSAPSSSGAKVKNSTGYRAKSKYADDF